MKKILTCLIFVTSLFLAVIVDAEELANISKSNDILNKTENILSSLKNSDVKEAASSAFPLVGSTGSFFAFGNYEQDNNQFNGKEPVVWYVLYKNEDERKALVCSVYILDACSFNEGTDVTLWATSTIRSWLNNDFMDDCFTEVQRKAIIPTEVQNMPTAFYDIEGNIDYVTLGEIPTYDFMFLPSLTEVNVWYNRNKLSNEEYNKGFGFAKECLSTPYAEKKGMVNYRTTKTGSKYWLRSLATEPNKVCYVKYDQGVDTKNGQVAQNICGVRPAMWVYY